MKPHRTLLSGPSQRDARPSRDGPGFSADAIEYSEGATVREDADLSAVMFAHQRFHVSISYDLSQRHLPVLGRKIDKGFVIHSSRRFDERGT
jgi:hypothetical protein